MSEGLVNIAGKRSPKLEINGKAYTLKPMILAEYAEREAYILSRRPSPLEAIERLPPIERPSPVHRRKDETPEEYEPRRRKWLADIEEFERKSKLRDELTKRAFKEALQPQFVSIDEDNAFDNSLHGIAWKLWRALRDNHPEIDSVQAALDLLESAGSDRMGEINSALEQSQDEDILGNSSGPVTGHQQGRDKEHRGDAYTEISLENLDGASTTSTL